VCRTDGVRRSFNGNGSGGGMRSIPRQAVLAYHLTALVIGAGAHPAGVGGIPHLQVAGKKRGKVAV